MNGAPGWVLIAAWTDRGWLRPLDRAFADFLAGLDATADPGCLVAAALASHQLGRGHVCLDLEALWADPGPVLALPPEAGSGETALADLRSALAWVTLEQGLKALSACSWVGQGPGTAPLVLDGSRLYLRRYWDYEQRVGAALRARLAVSADPLPDLAGRLESLFPPRAGASGPDWQRIACGLAARGLFTVITGGPGTGKTYSVVRLLALLQSQNVAGAAGRSLRIRLAAPTGKAAARLTESIGAALATLPSAMQAGIPAEACTLHRLLGARPDTRRFRHHAGNPLHADLVVVDEASMIDLELMAALLDALRPETRLVLLGDKDQLASVEAGSVLGDLCRDADPPGYRAETIDWIGKVVGEAVGLPPTHSGSLLAQHLVCLRESRRFTAGSGIGALARAVNAGDAAGIEALWKEADRYPDIRRIGLTGLADRQLDRQLEQLVLAGGNAAGTVAPGRAGYRAYLECIRKRPATGESLDAYLSWAGRVLDAFSEFQLLCALRHGPYGVEGLNHRIGEILQRAGLIDPLSTWYEGRPVLVTANDYGLGLMNGDVGITLRFPAGGSEGGPGRLRVVFRQPDRRLKLVLPSRLGQVETVYAMTVHKAQGSEFTHVALVLPDQPSPVLTRELVYTGITRAKRWLSLVLPEAGILADAVGRRVQRVGRLADLCG